MKRFLLLAGIILMCFVINAQNFAQEETKQTINIASEYSAPENHYMINGVLGLFNNSASKENGQNSFQRLFPRVQKFLYGGFLLTENAELDRKNKISAYVFYAECHILRLEGIDIIHPFNYFW